MPSFICFSLVFLLFALQVVYASPRRGTVSDAVPSIHKNTFNKIPERVARTNLVNNAAAEAISEDSSNDKDPVNIANTKLARSDNNSVKNNAATSGECPLHTWSNATNTTMVLPRQHVTDETSKLHFFNRLSQHSTTGLENQLSKRAGLGAVNPASLPPSSDNMFNRMDANWKSSYDKGVARWRLLQARLKAPPKRPAPYLMLNWVWTPQTDAPPFTSKFSRQCGPNGILSFLDNKYNSNAEPDDKLCSGEYYNVGLTNSEGLPANTPPRNYFVYDNWYSTSARTIVADVNYGRRKIPAGDPGGNSRGALYKAPNRWAEAVMAVWFEYCRRPNIAPSNLKFIPRIDVRTIATGTIVNAILQNVLATRGGVARYEWSPASPHFYAMLGTPHGNGPAELLTEYTDILSTKAETGQITQLKSLSSIVAVVDWEQPRAKLDLAFIFEDITPPPEFIPPPP